MATQQTSNPTGYATTPDLGPLFTPQTGPSGAVPLSTSIEVAMRSGRHWRRLILHDLIAHDLSILPEICDRIGALPNQISGRISDLRKFGYVIDTGQKRPHPVSKAACMVYSITQDGRDALAKGSI